MAKEENIILPALGALGIVLLFSGGNNSPRQFVPPPGVTLTPTDFIRGYWPEARYSQTITTIPALFTITQAGLESGWGAHAPGYNFFGIKDSAGWTGATQMLPTTEYVNGVLTHITAKFRAYSSARDGFIDHGRFFIDNSRYHPALKYVDNPIDFVRMISAEGYASDPNYADKMITNMKIVVQVLQRYNLI